VTRTRGLTLIELMLTLVVLGVLAAIAVPALGRFLANAQVRGVAEEMRSGIELARAEAIRRNTEVRFIPNGTGWNVVAPGAGANGADLTLASRSPRQSPATVAAVPAQIAFSGSGWTTPFGTSMRLSVSAPGVGNCRPDGVMDCRNVTVMAGGAVRSCATGAPKGSPTACQ
jgi:type IV fimbrial biogenesis protein FimT